MPYAVTGQVSQKPLTDGIEITDTEYKQAIQAAQDGNRIVVESNQLKILSNEKYKVYSTSDGSSQEIYVDDTVPTGYTDKERPSEFHVWSGNAWVKDESLELQAWRESASVSKFQAKMALKQAGLLDQVRTVIQQLPENDATRIAWEDAQEFKRLSPTVLSIALELNLSETDLDNLFEQAELIEA